MVYALVLVRGTVLAIDNPARQAFVSEIVGPDRVVNAVALNSVVVHSSRIAGPAAAGALIALVGVAACFAVNAATFVVMLVALRLMDPALLQRAERAPRERGQLRAALAYVRATPGAADPARDDGRSSARCPSTSRCCCRCSPARRGTAPPRPTRR